MANAMLNEIGYTDTKKYADQSGFSWEGREDKEI